MRSCRERLGKVIKEDDNLRHRVRGRNVRMRRPEHKKKVSRLQNPLPQHLELSPSKFL